jgi:hypothetical protein
MSPILWLPCVRVLLLSAAGSSCLSAAIPIERNPPGKTLIDEPIEASAFAPCCRFTSCEGEIEARIIASL